MVLRSVVLAMGGGGEMRVKKTYAFFLEAVVSSGGQGADGG